jgi:peptide/nickel transport system ATP-binding protein
MGRSPAKEILRIEDLCLRFHTEQGTVEALDHFNLSVRRGEIMGLVGESGCGKTVTARCILRVISSPPGDIFEGKILFQGRDILSLPERELTYSIRGSAISTIPQDPLLALNPLFTVYSQMAEIIRWNSGESNGRNRSPLLRWMLGPLSERAQRSARRDQILDLMRQVHIPSPERQLDKYPHEFSGGQRQRILIAMALSTMPDMIIADEPSTALDVTIQAQILKLLRELVKSRDISVLFITHDFGVVARICDRVTVMYAGQEVEESDASDLFEKPSHPYTSMLMDMLPDRQQQEIRGIPGSVPTLVNPPPGCRFHPRCDQAMPVCSLRRPDTVTIGPSHRVRCHLFQDK